MFTRPIPQAISFTDTLLCMGDLDLDLDLYIAGTILAIFATELGERNANKTWTLKEWSVQFVILLCLKTGSNTFLPVKTLRTVCENE